MDASAFVSQSARRVAIVATEGCKMGPREDFGVSKEAEYSERRVRRGIDSWRSYVRSRRWEVTSDGNRDEDA